MDTPIPIDLGRIAQDLQIRRIQVESVVQLLDEGNTVPFITRYRKERTGGLNEVVIREIQRRVSRLRDLAQRKETILKAIEAQGRLTEELSEAIRKADNSKRLEDLYLPYKPKKRTKASEARDKGLEPLALRIWNRDETLIDLRGAAAEFLNPEKGVENADQVLEGVGHILAESISELANVRDAIRRVLWRAGRLVTSKTENLPEGQGLEYRDYFNYSEPVGHIPPHRVLAINRGDKEGPLKVRFEVPRDELEGAIKSQLPLEGHPQSELFTSAAIDSLDRLLLPSLEREIRRDLTEMAEAHAVDVFARNLRSLLLQPPIPNQVVLAIDPGFRTGCKVAVLDSHGGLLDHGVIHPHQPQNRRHESKLFLKNLIGKHQVTVVAIGNGTACRETEELVAEIIAEGTRFHQEVLEGKIPAPTEAPPSPAPEPHAETPATVTPDAAEGVAAEATPVAEDQSPASVPSETTESETMASVEDPEPEPVANETPSETQEPFVAENVESAAAEPSTSHAEAQGEMTEETRANNGDGESSEVIPPVSGGAPDEEETPVPDPTAPTGDAPERKEEPVEASAEPEPPTEATASQEPTATEPESSAPAEASSEPAPDAPPEVAAEVAEAIGGTPPSESNESAATESSAPVAEGAPTAGTEESAAAHAIVGLTQPPIGPEGKPVAAVTETKEKEKEKGRPRGGRSDSSRPPKPKGPPPPPAPHVADPVIAQLSYVIVNEAGASVYSTSPAGKDEFPDYDATLRGTISIGRRLQDPLSELVKIEPQNIGVGLYQHDISPKELKESLESVIESCVNFVGVDLNTASVPLLRHVSGLNELTARRIVERRQQKAPFQNRDEIREIEGIGPVTFTQAAAFLKLRDVENPLDRTWVHPESYEAATKLLESLGLSTSAINDREQLQALRERLDEVDIPAKAQELGIGEPTLADIMDALARPDRDPREDLPKPIFKKGVLKLEDLEAGMELKGTVLNVVDFGAFVDIGLKDSGLVHISQLANRYIKSPHDVVSVGDVVSVWVMSVDHERKRVSLTMVAPGSERPRPVPGERGRRGPGGPPGERGERPDRGDRRGGGGGGGRGGPRREQGAPEGRAPEGQAASGEGGGEASSASSAGPRLSARIPGPPQRAMSGRGGRGPGRPGGRGPGRPGGRGPGPDRDRGPTDDSATPRPKPRSSTPPPLTKDALTGNSPLRSFGQLKQLWESRTESPEEGENAPPPADTPEPTTEKPAEGTE